MRAFYLATSEFVGRFLVQEEQETRDASREAILRARDKVLARDEYQTNLPTDEWIGASDPSWLVIIEVIAFLMKAGLFLFMVLVVVFVVRLIIDRQRQATRKSAQRSGVANAIRGENFTVDMSSIHALAQAGSFGEAIHSLLLKTLQELCRLAALDLPPAMTSREILAEIPLESNPKSDLSALVTATEVSHFGGVEASEEDFHNCIAHFERFVTSLGGKVA